MQFIKKHYEKVLLSIVLLGLAAAAAWLPWQVSHERDRLEEIRRNLTVKVKAKPFKGLDDWLSTNKTTLARVESPLNLELSGPHNLFNPVQWKKMPDGALVPIRTGSELGPRALKIAQIRELTMKVIFDGVESGGGSNDPPKYKVTIKNQAKDKTERGDQRTVSMNAPRLNLFELVNVQGPTNDPVALVLKLKDGFEPITVTKDKAYEHVVGYTADLVYPPGKQPLNNKRTGDEIKLEGDPERYKIVAITQNEVVLSADSNKRRTVIKYNGNVTASTKP
jgi:hypothetical protein